MYIGHRARVLVLGGGYAGMLAAARIARRQIADVTLIDQRARFVERIRLHEVLAGASLRGPDYGPWLARRGVAFVQARVIRLDPARQEVQIAADDIIQRLGYDILVLALGSAGTADVPGIAAHGIHLDDPATLTHASAALRRLAGSGGRVVVVGGGLTAIESAAELAAQLPGLRITLATRKPLGAGFSPQAGRYLRTSLGRLGVIVQEGAHVTALEPGRAWLASGDALMYDRCIWAGGFRAPALLAEAGLSVDAQGRASVCDTLHLPGNPTIFIAGDCAAAGDSGHVIRMGCVSAMPLGVQAGENVAALLAGRAPQPFSFGFPGRNVSLGRRDGLVQITDQYDQPSGRILTGWAAATVKELVCRMTLEVVRGELRSGLPLYHWRGGDGWWVSPAVVA